MNWFWSVVVGCAVSILVVWLILIAVMMTTGRRFDRAALQEVLRLLPDLLRLLGRLATDRQVPLGVRVRLWLLLAYLASPIDLVPDFIPVIGYADDAVITAVVLRSVVRGAGPDVLERHWPGTDEGLAAVLRAVGVRDR
ncbi:YkvA family protein [Glycomyces rhizosphaerae]|uniref:YkvA family protein n=1 Tax=Glycomyces rhizosphaerae TaxID=2054422 RepID=A0ABV7PXR2_9ACTN